MSGIQQAGVPDRASNILALPHQIPGLQTKQEVCRQLTERYVDDKAAVGVDTSYFQPRDVNIDGDGQNEALVGL